MRYCEIMQEANHGERRYYHGTPSQHAARTILQDGLEPQTVAKTLQRQNAAPQAGYIYLTPHVSYALNYTMGFFMAPADRLKLRLPIEGNEARFQWLARDGRGFYGYMFVIYAATILADLQPDEDVIGALYNAAITQGIHWALEAILPKQVYQTAQADPEALARFVRYIESVVAPATRAKLHNAGNSDSAIGWASKIGKIAVRKMDPAMKAWLLKVGSHAGSAQRLLPDEGWRFDRRKIGWVEPDAANFFDLAERIK